MKQTEFEEKLARIISSNVHPQLNEEDGESPEALIDMPVIQDQILQLIDEEIVGEDEPEQEGGVPGLLRINMPSPDQIARNGLRQEQREALGISERGLSEKEEKE